MTNSQNKSENIKQEEKKASDSLRGIKAILEQSLQSYDKLPMLEIIFEDEKTHVQAGTRWFHYLCQEQSLDPQNIFQTMVQRYFTGRLKPPFNDEARAQAGLPVHYYHL